MFSKKEKRVIIISSFILVVLFSLLLTNPFATHIAKAQITTGYSSPVGINVDGGAMFSNGTSTTYSFVTNGLKGVFVFDGGNFYSGAPVDENAFSVQLNSNLLLSNFQDYFIKEETIVNYNSTTGTYGVCIIDEIFNATTDKASISPNLISGNGGVTVRNGISFYRFEYITKYKTSVPFNITLWYFTSLNSRKYPTITFYFQFSNSTYISPHIKLDNVTISITSSSANIQIGGIVYPYVAQFVVGGAYDGATLEVYSWRAYMKMYYLYNGNWYVPPSATTLPPKLYSGAISNESVSGNYGMAEEWINSNASVLQIQGVLSQENLWTIFASAKLVGTTVIFYVIPNGARWIGEVTQNGRQTSISITNGSSVQVEPGSVSYFLKLYAGTSLVYTSSGTLQVVGGPVIINSPVPFTVNGTEYSPGEYTFNAPVTVVFQNVYYESNNVRDLLKGVIYDGVLENENTFTIYYGPAYLTAIYYTQYYVTFQFTVTGFVNGVQETLTSGWYNASTVIYIPSQIISVNSTVRYITLPINIVITEPMSVTIPYNVEYYVTVTHEVPALINGQNVTLTSGWFNKSSTILIYKVYYINSSSRELVNASQYLIVVNSPLYITTNIIGYQDLVGIYWPNSTITYAWYNVSQEIKLPTYIYINSTARYLRISNATVTVKEPTIIIPKYIIQYFVTVRYPNGTEISGWHNSSSIIVVPKIIYINSTARYVLNSSAIYVTKGPENISPSYLIQYLVSVELPNSTTFNYWVLRGSSISVPKIVNVSPTTIAILVGKNVFTIYYPQVIKPKYEYKYLVTVYLPNGQIIKEFITNGSSITYPSIIYISKGARYVIIGKNSTLITSPTILVPKYQLQYYLTIFLPNGTTIEGWYNNGSVIYLPKTISITSYERYVLSSPTSVVVNSSTTIVPKYILEYYVDIRYTNGTTISGWYSKGSEITLYAKAPFYYRVDWNGTFMLANGAKVLVTQPIFENEVLTLRIYLISTGIIGIVAIILAALFVNSLLSKPRKGGSAPPTPPSVGGETKS
ncbi:MAG: thermopsin family protease [Sulfolobaceae archaeon]|nr:thermopsin family protease [Sulfolobaceae archaeon]